MIVKKKEDDLCHLELALLALYRLLSSCFQPCFLIRKFVSSFCQTKRKSPIIIHVCVCVEGGRLQQKLRKYFYQKSQ